SIGAVCTGTHVLAKAGLLDGYRCAIHWENYDSFREDFPEIEVTQELFEFDRNRFTCAGGTAAVDMMLALVATKKGAGVAALVTDEMIHHR
ncbi:AraC family transcriptional regulator, partial [Acinetobacter baumannii]